MTISRGPFEHNFSDLPAQIPLFPLPGALLLPGGRLSLTIFEPRYLVMIHQALARPHRLIGMIQTRDNQADGQLYDIGCAGRISHYSETDDGQLDIILSGTSRFCIERVINLEEGYKQADISFAKFKKDLLPDHTKIDRRHLIHVLRRYFKHKGYTIDLKHSENCADEKLISSLSMICPLTILEKQALLESADLSSRTELLIAILEMASHGEGDERSAKH